MGWGVGKVLGVGIFLDKEGGSFLLSCLTDKHVCYKNAVFMKSNWIWVYIKYKLEEGGWIFYLRKGGLIYMACMKGVAIFFWVTDQIFPTTPPTISFKWPVPNTVQCILYYVVIQIHSLCQFQSHPSPVTFLRWTLPSICHRTYFHTSKDHVTWIIKKFLRIVTWHMRVSTHMLEVTWLEYVPSPV